MSSSLLPTALDFAVWRDPLLEEWMGCPAEELTAAARATLTNERIAVRTVTARSLTEALDQVRTRAAADPAEPRAASGAPRLH